MNTGWKRWLHKCLRDTALFAHHTSDWEPRVKQLTRLTPGLQLSSQSQITTGKHWMGRSQQGRKERASIDNGQAGICGSYSPHRLWCSMRSPSISMGLRSRTDQW